MNPGGGEFQGGEFREVAQLTLDGDPVEDDFSPVGQGETLLVVTCFC
jgi:hypothetical protein